MDSLLMCAESSNSMIAKFLVMLAIYTTMRIVYLNPIISRPSFANCGCKAYNSIFSTFHNAYSHSDFCFVVLVAEAGIEPAAFR